MQSASVHQPKPATDLQLFSCRHLREVGDTGFNRFFHGFKPHLIVHLFSNGRCQLLMACVACSLLEAVMANTRATARACCMCFGLVVLGHCCGVVDWNGRNTSPRMNWSWFSKRCITSTGSPDGRIHAGRLTWIREKFVRCRVERTAIISTAASTLP